MIWKNIYKDCIGSFNECEYYANIYLKWLYNHGYEPELYYDESTCGPVYVIKVNISGYDLILDFDYLETSGEYSPDIFYCVYINTKGIKETAVSKLQAKYNDEFDETFTCVDCYDEEEIIKSVSKIRKQTYFRFGDEECFRPKVIICGGYPYSAENVGRNMFGLVREINKKDGIVRKIREEIERLQIIQKLSEELSYIAGNPDIHVKNKKEK